MNAAVLTRKEFFGQLALLTNDALHSTRQHGLIILDIDAFRFVNASSGYAAGDYLINLLEQHLMGLLSCGYIGANLGAGSFAILMPNAELSEIKALECALRQSVRERDFTWQEETLHITLSSGATLLFDCDDDESVPFSRAELALFQAKQLGNDCTKFAHAPEPAGDVPVAGWAPKIHHAFLYDGFRLWLQPVIDVASKQTVLIDVSYSLDVDGEQVRSQLFQEELIAMGMALTLDRWLIRKLRDYVLARRADGDRVRYVFNVSSESVKAAAFLKFLKAELCAQPELCLGLALGFSYRNLSSDFDCMREFADSVHHLGLPLVLDDFGASENSLLDLSILPVSYVRPQAQWFNEESAAHRKMVPILAGLIQASGRQALGMGADTESALNNLQQQGFALAQGALQPPLPC